VINLTSFVCLVLPCPLWSRPKVRWVTLQGSHPMRGNKELSSSTAKQTGLSDLGVRTEVQFYSVGLQTQSGRTFQDTSTTNRRLLYNSRGEHRFSTRLVARGTPWREPPLCVDRHFGPSACVACSTGSTHMREHASRTSDYSFALYSLLLL
jgi:hypothetical protein